MVWPATSIAKGCRPSARTDARSGFRIGLTVARRPEHQQGSAVIDRRQQLADVIIWEDQAGQSATQPIGGHHLVREQLLADLLPERRQIHRGGPQVRIHIERLAGRRMSLMAHLVADVGKLAARDRADRLHQLAADGLFDQLNDDPVGQPHGAREIRSRLQRFKVHEFERKAQEQALREAGLGQGSGRGGRWYRPSPFRDVGAVGHASPYPFTVTPLQASRCLMSSVES